MRTLIIGDIHGCYDELQALLDQSGIGQDDQIISIGDMVDRGEASDKTLFFFRDQPNARAIMGNHEVKHLVIRDGHVHPFLGQLLTRWQFNNEYDDALAYMDTLPFYLELPDAILVHGFLEPEKSLEEQEKPMLAGLQSREKYLQENWERPWYEYYTGGKPVIVGHRDYSQRQAPFVYKDKVFGLDSRCVLGGKLSGLILPDFRILSVAAPRNYWQAARAKYAGYKD